MRTSILRTAARSASLQLGSTSAATRSAPAAARAALPPSHAAPSTSQPGSRRASARGISGSASSASLALEAVQSDRDVQFLRQVSVGDPQSILAESLQSTLVHTPLAFLHPSTRGPEQRRNRSFVPLSSHVFGIQPRVDILHAAVVYYLDGLRAGTASTKTRGEVAYSGRKLRPQKGSGQARLGTRGNPLLRGGGVAHGPKPRDFSTKLPRRVRELALRSALSARWRNHDLHVVPTFGGVDPPPSVTGPMRRLLGSKGWDRALFLTAPRSPATPARAFLTSARPSAADPVYTPEQLTEHQKEIANFKRAVGNIPNTEVIELDKLPEEAVRRMLQRKGRRAALEVAKRPGELHAYQVLRYPKVICDLGAIEWLEEKLGGAVWHGKLEDASFASEAAVDAVSASVSGDEDFAPGVATTISEVDESAAEAQGQAAGEAEAEALSEQAELNREADDILRSAGVEVTPASSVPEPEPEPASKSSQ
ncbi:54S ribosomal protein yml6, mitochondrial [Tilletia horrida]|nr:54S ribosomal protein yml6, mitochondrial [Tilletia horrida]KAK0559629.1 54S ribosomal protein yml6, mitochondrial [Tilletia horrida]